MPVPPSSHAALAGAEVLVNLSASNITIGKAEARRLLCGSQSARGIAAYAYSASGPGESTTDLAWDGHAAIYECGDQLVESPRFEKDSTIVRADVDLGRIRQERLRNNGFADCAMLEADKVARFRKVDFVLDAPRNSVALERAVERFPYVPSDPAKLRDNCYEAYNIQIQGLAQRLQASRSQRAIIGVSGGLDSTQALIVTCRAMDQLGLPRKNVLAYTLPGFGTSDKTHKNAWRLMTALGVTAAEIDIKPAANQMLADIGHPFAKGKKVYDVTFENVQAGLRTDYLFRLANQNHGMVVGTGDLSELGLGWCTYGVGDHMSHYNPNGSVSKTLIQHLIRFVAASDDVDQETAAILHDILDTEISPELIPAGDKGAIQSTEQSVGPYALQDFNLFYLTRLGFRPSKIAFLAWNAWHDVETGTWPANLPAGTRRAYTLAEIRQWLELFLRRFFTNQFKRSALPNGPKISSGGSLSPRGDWRAPSDGSPDVWLAELSSVPRPRNKWSPAGGGTPAIPPSLPPSHMGAREACDGRSDAQHLVRKCLLHHRQGARVRRAGRGDRPDSGSNAADDRMASVLEAHSDDRPSGTAGLHRALSEEEQTDLVALMWLGRGDGTLEDWIDLRGEAERQHNNRTAAYLLASRCWPIISRRACRSSGFRVRNSKSTVSDA